MHYNKEMRAQLLDLLASITGDCKRPIVSQKMIDEYITLLIVTDINRFNRGENNTLKIMTGGGK